MMTPSTQTSITILCFIVNLTVVYCQMPNATSKGNVTCGSLIGNSDADLYDVYRFEPSVTTAVNIDTCDSNSDISVIIFNETFDVISNWYCYEGDNCGWCTNGNDYYIENFTIPSDQSNEMVYLVVYTWESGEYKVNINCNASEPVYHMYWNQTDTTDIPYVWNQTDDSDPKPSVPYIPDTKKSLYFVNSLSPWLCDHLFKDHYVTSTPQLLSKHIHMDNNYTKISLQILVNESCSLSYCNILTIVDDINNVTMFSLSLNKEINILKIETINSFGITYSYGVPNVDNILLSDTFYHRLDITFTQQQNIFEIDGVTY
eukprot:427808_1